MNSTSIYSKGAVATCNALSDIERKWMIGRINQAYEVLMNPQLRSSYDRKELGLTEEALQEIWAKVKQSAPPSKSVHVTTVKLGQNRVARKANIHEAHEKFQSRRLGGEDLKNIRIAKGASLEQISGITKVKISYLEAIEQENTGNFPAPVFMKGFLKAYAKALGLDPEEITAQYMAKMNSSGKI